ncbi:hypothetical protein BJ912DRAFT_389943 [Pholiota molesta]|nr:hypothetical protein BJ912DRAFT_389943 [Pholiota molesta]
MQFFRIQLGPIIICKSRILKLKDNLTLSPQASALSQFSSGDSRTTMRFTALTAMLALAAHTSCIAAYSVSVYQGSGCNVGAAYLSSITVVGSNPDIPEAKSCFQIPFQGQSISVAGCTTSGTVTPFTDSNCITPANVAIPGTGILCLETTPLKSFSITGC